MKYFIDTEFLEGVQKTWIPSKPTIDLISIGIVAEDGREYYAISKDFNLKEAWNRYDENPNMDYKPTFCGGFDGHYNPQFIREYWIRDNVLKPIFIELRAREVEEYNVAIKRNVILDYPTYSFCYKEFKRLIKKYGKSNKQIAGEVLDFINTNGTLIHKPYDNSQKNIVFSDIIEKYGKPEFYGYYCDYDWVVFCWLFGKMIDLPKGFPMYCIDLKQTMDNKLNNKTLPIRGIQRDPNIDLDTKLKEIKYYSNYPKQTNEHNALADAKWTYELYEFLKTL